LLIAHLSDPHLTTGPLSADPAAALHRAISRVLGLDPRPDCLIITGDTVNEGRADEYLLLRSLLDRYQIPIYLAAGNHDNRRELLAVFAGTDYLGNGRRPYYAVQLPEALLVILDSSEPGMPPGSGCLGDEQLVWLDQTLVAHADQTTFVCVHHPPAAIGIPFLDAIGLTDSAALAGIIGRHTQIVRILSGHIHRGITTSFAGTTLSIAPSTYLQSDLVLCADRPIGFVAEPAAFLLHILHGSYCSTHYVPVSHTTARLGTF
jgi:Icc protein